MNRRARGVLREAADLAARGEPFALATVVWSRAPTSGKPGAKALVTREGRVHGWLGGACSEPVVVREAIRAMEEGRGRLLHLGPPAELEEAAREGVVLEPIGCAGEGTVEVFVEPHLPSPRLLLFGNAPLLDALEMMGREVDLDVSRAREPPGPDEEGLRSFPPARGRSPTYAVVATLGRYDEAALEAALASGAEYVGLVASRTRAASVLDTLRASGVPEDDLRRIRAPAGLDLGPLEHAEIAVAILAEILGLKARRGAREPDPEGAGTPSTAEGAGGKAFAEASPSPTPAADPGSPAAAPPAPSASAGEPSEGSLGPSPSREAVDPVCGMAVRADGAGFTSEWEGRSYYFCCDGCRRRFRAEPERYAGAADSPGRREGP